MAGIRQHLRNPPLLFEGAMGTELIAHGLPHGAPGEGMTRERPDVVREVHRQYLAAGAMVLKTNTFNANPARLTQCGMRADFEMLNRRAVQLARSEVGPTQLVAGVLGPTVITEASDSPAWVTEVSAAYCQQASVLAAEGVDLLLIETMYDLREAQTALAACRAQCDLPVLVTMTFTETPSGFVTRSGHAAADALRELTAAGADAVGSNCALNSSSMVELAHALRAALPGATLLIQPCAGQPRAVAGGWEYADTPEDFARRLAPLAAGGIELLGGCCGTTPSHIAALRAALNELAAA